MRHGWSLAARSSKSNDEKPPPPYGAVNRLGHTIRCIGLALDLLELLAEAAKRPQPLSNPKEARGLATGITLKVFQAPAGQQFPVDIFEASETVGKGVLGKGDCWRSGVGLSLCSECPLLLPSLVGLGLNSLFTHAGFCLGQGYDYQAPSRQPGKDGESRAKRAV